MKRWPSVWELRCRDVPCPVSGKGTAETRQAVSLQAGLLPSPRSHPTSVPYTPCPECVRIVATTRKSPSLPGLAAHVQFR